MKTNVMPLLTAEPESGTNTVIVGHDDIFESATGIYPAPQGIAYVVKPDGMAVWNLSLICCPKNGRSWGATKLADQGLRRSY